jgi:pimeloyl-ACP methyl ester carboxylesterase
MNKKREKEPAKLKWMQRFFSVAGNIAPNTTIKILVKLLYSPKKRDLKPAHIECMSRAQTFKFEVDEFRNPKKKIKLACYSWGTGEKTVLLVHGWDARAMDFYKMIPALVEEGYKVIAFDGPGHGNSEGSSTNLVDFKEIMCKLIKKKIGVPYAIIGHSMGGGAATYLLMDYDISVKRLVTIAIPTVSKRFFDNMFAAMKIPVRTQKVFYKSMAEEFGEPIEKYNLIQRKDAIKADKILMVYDEDDSIVPITDLKAFLAARPEVTPIQIKGVGHYRIIKSKQVIDEIIRFLK